MRLSSWPLQQARCPPTRSSTVWLAWVLLLSVFGLARCVCGMTDEEIKSLRQETGDIFYHGYDNYIEHAFPEDELRPVSCSPLTRDRENPAHIEVNDVLGNYSLTLIDSLSTLAILASSPSKSNGSNKPLKDFQDGIALLVEYYGDGSEGPAGQGKRARGFDLDSKVQVFETTIRGVGGLLSAHLFAIGELPITGYAPVEDENNGRRGIVWPNGFVYDGQLLRLALDLAERLLPAFSTETGLPYPRVNLRTGIPFYPNARLHNGSENGQCLRSPSGPVEITETCSAGAGSLVLEFSTLSRLTGDVRFERVAKKAFWAVWNRRSSVGLIGSGIDAETGHWVTSYTGIGAGIDSFFEYAFKSHVLLSGLPDDPENDELQEPDAFLATWEDAHAGISRHIYRGPAYQHPHYVQADLYTGALRAFWLDSLSAYYPGLLTLAGELHEAIETHLLYTALWTRYSALPERWSTASGNIEQGLRWWGGRPEFIESTWYLYRATQDPWYLHVGEMALRDIKRRCWTKCGWAGLQDVRSGEHSDRMESFFLGETAKYLFLLFDPSHPLNSLDAPFVFTTEGHPLIIPRMRHGISKSYRSTLGTGRSHYSQAGGERMCPVPPSDVPFSVSATAARQDIFHAASLARLHLMPSIDKLDSPLVEFTADHPSISVSDLQSPSNYTYYPWTLPPEFVPSNATSSKMAIRTTFDLSFPNLPNNAINVGMLQRIGEGILVNSMSGLRLGMIRESTAISGGEQASSGNNLADLFRIYAVSNVALGRDEKVFMSRDLVANFNPVDPYFTRARDIQALDLIIDAEYSTDASGHEFPSSGDSGRVEVSKLNNSIPILNIPDDFDISAAANDPSMIETFLQNLQNMLMEPLNSHTTSKGPSAERFLMRHELTASLPTGQGAAPLPDLDDPIALSSDDVDSPLPWGSIYIADELCNSRLPIEVARTHQVVVLKRGGCSFSRKLQNIPAFAPDAKALQLVVVVSWPEHDLPDPMDPPGMQKTQDSTKSGAERIAQTQQDSHHLIQPLLDAPQLTPGGMTRPHPIPMVMVNGGDRTMALLKRAKGIGVRRRWWFMSQGVRIGNLIVL